MFLGYQDDKIVLAANTRTEIENAPMIELSKIEETAEEYVLWNGKYVKKSEAVPDREELCSLRRNAFEKTTDAYLLQKLETVTTTTELFELLSDWKQKKNQIREEYPYI